MLSGTPLENRLDDLYSVVEFIDDRRLGPAIRFFNRHRVTDEKGKVLGYKDLDLLRENLKPVLLRRTRSSVMEDLPPRATEIVRVPPTAEQLDIEIAQMRIASSVLGKRYISEMDLLRLQKTYLGDAGGEPAQASHVSFVSLLHEGVDFIGEHPELRFHDSPHESTIDLRIAVDQDVAEGNNVVILAYPSRRLSIGSRELVQCFTDDFELSLDG